MRETTPDTNAAPRGHATTAKAPYAPGAAPAAGTPGTTPGAAPTPGAATGTPGPGTTGTGAPGPASAAGATGVGAPAAPGLAGVTGADPEGPPFPVIPPSDHNELTERLRHAVSGFVDAPRGAVEEADRLLEELSARLTELLADRRRTLRDTWSEDEAEGAGAVRTEELRLAMRGYRNVLERLLSI
ncbi:hypothetical protein [Streptomyces sparsogenes]|uniref:Uncharacterized protein n=1 Tax=Streptomyces sparsogenes DSM 40356 TaxID=1331668 RepID=A0A1R1SIB4_9ACTN|nr:hypothetical protein [Streptomyces sparsogenes]OMI38023.1 hypothetical protein SPAR_18183 [Streptomyces sparsogenes DSM 40356]